MADRKVVAAGIIGIIALVGGGTTAVKLNSSSAATTTTSSALGAPPLSIVSVGETEIQVDYGPSQPGPFTASNAKVKSLKISWPAAIDTLHPTGLTYTVTKNGTTIHTALINNYIAVGFTPTVTQFRICVKAVNSTGRSSPFGCTTFIGKSGVTG